MDRLQNNLNEYEANQRKVMQDLVCETFDEMNKKSKEIGRKMFNFAVYAKRVESYNFRLNRRQYSIKDKKSFNEDFVNWLKDHITEFEDAIYKTIGLHAVEVQHEKVTLYKTRDGKITEEISDSDVDCVKWIIKIPPANDTVH